MEIRARSLNGRWFESVLELAAVNAALWHAEDDLRDLRNGPAFIGMNPVSVIAEVAAAIGIRIQVLNDQRAVLVDKINKDAGEPGTGDKVLRDTVRETPSKEDR